MCGIVGYVGKKKALPILIQGLKALEYRGYDSAGISYFMDNKVNTIKSIGHISNLEKKINDKIDTNIGIGHTRWATHGGVNLDNCHPHTHGIFTIVHNGIIENYMEIKSDLIKSGYTFYGESDSEVVAALFDAVYQKEKDTLKTIDKATKKLKGSYALGILNINEKDTLYAVRKDSPLIIGISKEGNFIGSDILAFNKYTDKYILLDNFDITVLKKDSYKIYNNLKEIKKEINTLSNEEGEVSKGIYPHYMLKEINEEADLIRNNILSDLKDIPDIRKYKYITIVACGSAYHAGLVGSYLFNEYSNLEISCYTASEFRYRKLINKKDALVILISQSGETADTLASLRIAKENGIKTLAIVNVMNSSIAREADMVVYTHAGREIAVATTKAYLMQVYYLGLMTIKASDIKYTDMIKYYQELPILMEKLISYDYSTLAKKLYKKDNIFYLGRNVDYALSLEGSLKLKEISYIESVAYPSGELKHGTISLITDGIPVISIITKDDILDKSISNIKEVNARGAYSIIIAKEDFDIERDTYKDIIRIPNTHPILMPLLTVIPLQLISYEVAKLKGYDIDKPRNLAKSVTVE